MHSACAEGVEELIMTFLAVGTADVLNSYAVHLACPQVFVEAFVDAVELVAIVPGAVGEVDLGGTVTVDAPAHAERGELLDLIHLLDGAMAGLALYLAGLGVLRVAEEYMIG